MRLIGLDPGLRHTGWGVIEADGARLRYVACGVVDSAADDALARRLSSLYDGLAEVFRQWAPVAAAVEETVVNRNPGTSLRLGHARGVVLLAAARHGLAVAEYGSMEVKRAVTGTGHGRKEQVAMMVRMLLGHLVEAGADATDALAVAICHAHHLGTAQRLGLAMAAGPR
jgi:crossover junction endodeoxyribonuclease RuvC